MKGKILIVAGTLVLLVGAILFIRWYSVSGKLTVSDQVVGDTIAIESAKLPDWGFLIFYSLTDGKILAVSDVLEPGIYREVHLPVIDPNTVQRGTIVISLIILGRDPDILFGEHGLLLPQEKKVVARDQFKAL